MQEHCPPVSFLNDRKIFGTPGGVPSRLQNFFGTAGGVPSRVTKFFCRHGRALTLPFYSPIVIRHSLSFWF
jgi:hypothetical protein